MIEERTSITDYQTALSEFIQKFPDEKSWIENLCIIGIIKAYELVKTNLKREYDENSLRTWLTRNFKNVNNPLANYLNIVSIVRELNEDFEENGSVIREIRLDIVFFVGSKDKPIYAFVVECKQFKGYELSYVKGSEKYGVYIENGVERFVNAIYIRQQDKYAGMVGFYKNNTPIDLIANLQVKIKEYFPKTEFPNFQPEQFSHHPHSFLSYHPREDETDITVYHCILPI